MAKFTLGLANVDDASDTISLNIDGSDEWVKELIPCVHDLIVSIRQNAPFDVTNEQEVSGELRAAFAATEKGEEYTGKTVRTKIFVGATG